MSNVLIVAPRFWPAPGGVEQRLERICSHLKDDHEITVVTSDLERDSPWRRLENDAPAMEGVAIHRLRAQPLTPLDGYRFRLPGLGRVLRKIGENAEILDVHPYGSTLTDAAHRSGRKMGIRTILTPHFHPARTAHHPRLRHVYDQSWGRRTIRQAETVVAVSDAEAMELESTFKIERPPVIPNGIDVEQFRSTGARRDMDRLLCIGRMSDVKGFDVALNALARLRADGQDCRLDVIGDDWGEEATLKRLTKQLGLSNKVRFLGHLNHADLVDAMSTSAALLMPSVYEAFGITALEAAATGLPIIGSQAGGLPQAIGPAGIVANRTGQEFARAVQTLRDEPRTWSRLHQNGPKHAASYDWRNIASLVDELWEGR